MSDTRSFLIFLILLSICDAYAQTQTWKQGEKLQIRQRIQYVDTLLQKTDPQNTVGQYQQKIFSNIHKVIKNIQAYIRKNK